MGPLRWLVPAAMFVFAASAWGARRDGGTEPRDRTEDKACLECHGDETAQTDLENEEVLPLYVSADALQASVHDDVACTECHTDLKGQSEKGADLLRRRESGGIL